MICWKRIAFGLSAGSGVGVSVCGTTWAFPGAWRTWGDMPVLPQSELVGVTMNS